MGRSRRPSILVRLAVCAFLVLAPEVPALAGKAKEPKPKPARVEPHRGGVSRSYGGVNHRNSIANQNNGEVIQNLHASLTILARAQHDYQGHRVRAMHEIGAAIRHLEPQSATRNRPNPATAYLPKSNGSGGASIPQAMSDQHLRSALQSLNQIGSYISNNGTAPNHARALGSVRNAVGELNTALAIR